MLKIHTDILVAPVLHIRHKIRRCANVARYAFVASALTWGAGCAVSGPANDTAIANTVAQFTPAAPPAGVYDQATFLYYTDLAAPRHFYGKLLGLTHYYETPWVTLYRTAAGATLGVVKAPEDQVPADAKRDATMVSLVTDDVESWYRRLRDNAEIKIQKPLYDHPAVPIRAFLLRDPGGYSVEFFQWRTR